MQAPAQVLAVRHLSALHPKAGRPFFVAEDPGDGQRGLDPAQGSHTA